MIQRYYIEYKHDMNAEFDLIEVEDGDVVKWHDVKDLIEWRDVTTSDVDNHCGELVSIWYKTAFGPVNNGYLDYDDVGTAKWQKNPTNPWTTK